MMLWGGKSMNRIMNLFLRVAVKNIHKLTVQQDKTKKRERECYRKPYGNSKILGFCDTCKNIQGVIIWPSNTL